MNETPVWYDDSRFGTSRNVYRHEDANHAHMGFAVLFGSQGFVPQICGLQNIGATFHTVPFGSPTLK
jgi:hypothetical protein